MMNEKSSEHTKENPIVEKSFRFALRIIKLHQYLKKEKNEYILSKQILRCGTSIGANIEEAIGGQSSKDFFAKMNIAYKEARETNYWLRLLKESELLEERLSDSLLSDCLEIQKILSSILLTMQKKEK